MKLIPWRNSWFQLAGFAAVIALLVLVSNFIPGLSRLVGSKSSSSPAQTAGTSRPAQSESSSNFPYQAPAQASPPPVSNVPVAGAPTASKPWTNTLGMVFKPVPGLNVLFGQYDTRVKDYAAFVASGYQTSGDMYSSAMDFGWGEKKGFDWQNPGFAQTQDSPVVGVSWNDATAFCDWLTQKERGEGKLASNQSYRLPTNSEWFTAAGSDKYPWGDAWPPTKDAGNYADKAFAQSVTPSLFSVVPYNDGYPRSSPVGKFRANRYGLYDMGGNVWQWCQDYYDPGMASMTLKGLAQRFNTGESQTYRVLRGASWWADNPQDMLESAGWKDAPRTLETSYLDFCMPDIRKDNIGFRPVVVVSP